MQKGVQFDTQLPKYHLSDSPDACKPVKLKRLGIRVVRPSFHLNN